MLSNFEGWSKPWLLIKKKQEALLGLEKSHISKIYEACHTCYTVVQNLNMPHLLTEK